MYPYNIRKSFNRSFFPGDKLSVYFPLKIYSTLSIIDYGRSRLISSIYVDPRCQEASVSFSDKQR